MVNDTSTEIIIFVNCGAVGLWGTFIGVVLWITIHVKHIHNLLTYVNDTFSWDFSNNTLWYAPYKKFFLVKQTYLLQLWDELGIPHKCPKQLFSSWLTIIGFNVNMDTMTITMLAQAYTNLIAAICVFTNTGQRCPLHEFQRLAGWMNWSLNVYLLLCPGMSTLYNKMAGKTNSQGLSDGFWKHTVRTAVHVYNVTPISKAKFLTPKEMWSGSKLDISHLHIFGCAAYIHVLKGKRQKLNQKSQEMIFVGYKNLSKGWQFWDAKNQRI